MKGRHIRIEGLKKVNSLQPTAELRPLAQTQTDEADLMPYEFLNDSGRIGDPGQVARGVIPPFVCTVQKHL